MLSLFPGILYLAPFSAFILRIASALAFFYIAYRMLATREKIEGVRVPIVGHISDWMLWISAIVTFGTSVLLFIGLWTQAAAIVGMLICLKHLAGVRSYSNILPLSAGTYALLFAMCLSLLIAGAGPIAFDLPL
jgi:uncharacterized membrane protein YphA (DoxX/SURF4 family)